MTHPFIARVLVTFTLAISLWGTVAHAREPWTTSRLTGSPDPPPPYRTERLYPHLTFKEPTDLASPDGQRWFVVEQRGRVYSFTPDSPAPDLFIDLAAEIKTLNHTPAARGVAGAYGIAFHPRFAENRYCYIFYILGSKRAGEQLHNGTRVSRFRVTNTQPPRAEPDSEQIILEWRDGGHNGGGIRFGPDGCLYLTAGDSEVPSPPDPLKTGQDCSDLLGSILRIDVDHTEGGPRYVIPPDNPFVAMPGVRPEIWAYGFRNPWRISFDRATGDLWTGDVGWEMWELVYRVERGGNYGWSVVEGPQSIDPEGARGPTPILPPADAIAHPEAASITGGIVYRGQHLADLAGHYVYGDWETRRIWANRVEGTGLGHRREIARTDLRIISFAEDRDGEPLILDHQGGGVHRLVPSPTESRNAAFPTTLGETGLFTSLPEHRPSPGVYSFSIQAQQWADGATAQRFIAVPGDQAVEFRENPFIYTPGKIVAFPKNSVLAKTFTLAGRRVETQVLHFDGRAWNGYTYAWRDDQSDADLVQSAGLSRVMEVEGHKQLWRFQPRAQCAACHNPWVKFLLAYNEPQLGSDELRRLGAWSLVPPEWRSQQPLVDPHDPTVPLDRRARSYLHANCAHCHTFGGGGSATIDLRFELPLNETKAIESTPVQGHFGLKDARIIAPGDPFRSLLFYRMARLGPGRMPHVGSQVVDLKGLDLIEQWIASLDPTKPGRFSTEVDLTSTSEALKTVRAIDHGEIQTKDRETLIKLGAASPIDAVQGLFERFAPSDPRADLLDDPRMLLTMEGDIARGRRVFRESPAAATCRTCHRIEEKGSGIVSPIGPDLSHIGAKFSRAELIDQIADPSRRVDEPYVLTLVETTDGSNFAGFILERREKELVLQDLAGQLHTLPRGRIQSLKPQRTSAMPPQLLRAFTPQDAADLIAYLASLK